MKRHINLPELVQELQNENLKKRDFILPSDCLSMENGKFIISNCKNNEELGKILNETGIDYVDSNHSIALDCLDTMKSHLAEKLNIPSRYYQRMDKEALGLLDHNVTHWLRKANQNYMVRSFIDKNEEKGVARAILSDRFKVIDNYDILLAALSAIKETGLNIQLDSQGADISEKCLYLRFICPDIEIQAPELLRNYRPNGEKSKCGDGIISGFTISNSEVGAGALTIAARAVILACDNGMVKTDEKFHQRHLGARMEEFSTIQWSEDTKQKNLELIINQIKDSIKHFVSEQFLGEFVMDLINKGKNQVENPADCIKNVSNTMGFTEEQANDILSIFIKSGDTSAFGVTQALTYYAGRQEDPDLQWEIEKNAIAILDEIKTYDKPIAKKSVKTQAQLN